MRYGIIALAALLGLLWAAGGKIEAAPQETSVPFATAPEAPVASTSFAPPNERWIRNAQFNRVIPAMVRDGGLIYTSQDNYGWPSFLPSWRAVMAQSLDTGSPYSVSLGNVLRSWTWVREAQPGETAHVRLRAESSAFLAAKCGSGFAVACNYIYDALPVNIYFSGPSMATYIFSGQAAVAMHEVYHSFQACDQYRGGCPRQSDGVVENQFVCTGNSETLMDCGLAARFPQLYDIHTFFGAFVSDHASVVGWGIQGGWLTISWGCDRKDGGFASAFKGAGSACANASEVSFAFARRGQAPEWVGNLGCGPEWGWCFTSDEARGRAFDQYWIDNFDCGYIRLEGPIARFVDQSSALGLNGSAPGGYWQSVGCWR